MTTTTRLSQDIVLTMTEREGYYDFRVTWPTCAGARLNVELLEAELLPHGLELLEDADDDIELTEAGLVLPCVPKDGGGAPW